MHRTSLLHVAAVTLLLVPAAALRAAPLAPGALPSDTAWVAHLDVEQLLKTRVGTAMLEELGRGAADRKLAAFTLMLGLDPRRDITGFTAFGRDGDERNHVIAVRGRFDRARLETLLRAGDGYRAILSGGKTVHRWTDEKKDGKKTLYGVFASDDCALVGQSQAAVVAALGAMDGRGPGLSAEAPLRAMLPKVGGPFVLAVADFGAMPDAAPQAAILRQAKAGILELEERQERLGLKLGVTARDEAGATQMLALAQGMLALATLNAAQNPELAALAQAAAATREGMVVTLTAAYPVDTLAAWLRKGMRERELADAQAPDAQP